MIYPELHQIGVEQFFEMLRFVQRKKLEEFPDILRFGWDDYL
jgi:hypothetical protein